MLANRIDGTQTSSESRDDQMTSDLSLQSWFETASDEKGEGYPCARCAGLMRSLFALLDDGSIDPAIQEVTTNTAAGLNGFLPAARLIFGKGDVRCPDARMLGGRFRNSSASSPSFMPRAWQGTWLLPAQHSRTTQQSRVTLSSKSRSEGLRMALRTTASLGCQNQ